MILTDLYVMTHFSNRKPSRWDCTASTQSYDMFEVWAQAKQKDAIKRLKLYEVETNHINADPKRKADRAITSPKGKNVSSIYVDIENPQKAYGNIYGTEDAILFLYSKDFMQMEIFIARGYKRSEKALFALFVEGELDEDIERLREMAKPTNAD